jgi:hypothetical protein
MTPVGFQDKVAFVWKCADKPRHTFKQNQRGSAGPARPHHTAPGLP